MIPWWGWLALWSSLVLVALIVLVLGAWLLFRKFVRVLNDFDGLAARSAVLSDVVEAGDVRPPVAILEPFSSVWQRSIFRRQRRSERKVARRRARLVRARKIIAVDATTISRFKG